MNLQLDNIVLSSLKLFIENKLLIKGQAFSTTSGHFYPVNSQYNSYYAYSSPYQPIIADSSIPGATIMSGVYLDNTFITTGQSGLFNIDYEKGIVYFDSGISAGRISGTYSFADYNVKLTAESDATLLLENKFNLKPKYNQTLSGIQPTDTTFPIIYLRNNGTTNEGFAFGGLDCTTINVRAVVLADSAFMLDATNSIFRDLKELYVPLLSGEFPYNSYGGLRTGYYNYNNFNNKIPNDAVFITYSDVSKFLQNVRSDTKILPANIYVGFVDMGLELFRYPRQ